MLDMNNKSRLYACLNVEKEIALLSCKCEL